MEDVEGGQEAVEYRVQEGGGAGASGSGTETSEVISSFVGAAVLFHEQRILSLSRQSQGKWLGSIKV